MLNHKPMKKPIYLTGPMRNYSASQREEFRKAKIELEQLHKRPVYSALDENEFENAELVDFPNEDLMRNRISNLLQCGMLVHLADYEYDIDASFEYRMAKFLNMKIIGINFALKPESIHGNNDTNQSTAESSHVSDQQG
jgi:hypothetical protein